MVKLTNERKAFLLIWIVVMAMPAMFMIGMVIEQQPLNEVIRIDHQRGVRIINTRTWEWRDIYPNFILIGIATLFIYFTIGDEKEIENKNTKSKK
jgi:hypothetical protein